MKTRIKYVNIKNSKTVLSSDDIPFLTLLSQGSSVTVNQKEYQVQSFSQIIDTEKNDMQLIVNLNPQFIEQIFIKADFLGKDYIDSNAYLRMDSVRAHMNPTDFSHARWVLNTLCEVKSPNEDIYKKGLMFTIEDISMKYTSINHMPPHLDAPKFNEFVAESLAEIFNEELKKGHIVRIK